jgi:hypothetical protein
MKTGDTLQLVTHVWNDRLCWFVIITPRGGRRYVAARGIAERPLDPVDDSYGQGIMESAYDAYRALGA